MLRRLRKILCLTLIALLALSALTPALAASSGVSAKLTSSAKVYKKASTSSASVTVKKGTKVTVTAVKGSWAQIKAGGKTGYINKKYLSATGSSSSSTASRTKKYANKNTYVYKRASTSSGKWAVAANTALYVVGSSGDYYQVQNASGSATGYVKKSCVSSDKVTVKASSKTSDWKAKVVKMDWFKEGQYVLKKGSYGYIYDIDTGIQLKIKRMGGHYHADVEPATVADTAKLLKIANGNFSWKSHAVILMAGNKYVASAINTLPHGDQTIKNNNYDGQFCLHTTNSLTHCSSKENVNHQASIDKAYSWAHK